MSLLRLQRSVIQVQEHKRIQRVQTPSQIRARCPKWVYRAERYFWEIRTPAIQGFHKRARYRL